MSFWDNVKKFTQPYSDDEYDDYDEEDMTDNYEDEMDDPAPRARRTSSFNIPAKEDTGLDFGTVTPASPAPSASSSGFSGQILNSGFGSKQEVVLFHAVSFNDASRAADSLRSKKAIILNMENVDKALTRRVVDFLSGCVYALDGTVRKVAQSTYLFCPHGMDVVGDLENVPSEVESYI